MLQNARNGWDLHSLDFVFVKNVGSLMCPSSCDFGGDWGFVPLSVAEGQDKSLKCPTTFNNADPAIITKSDLDDAVECEEAAAGGNMQAVRAGMEVFRLSAKTGEGIKEFL